MIYLDYQATTPCDPRVVEAMLPYLTTHFGNPHSTSHPYGWTAQKAVEDARLKVSLLINADPREIVFTSGATESNNLAIKGLAYYHKKGKIIITKTEHKSVFETARALQREGFDITYLSTNSSGIIDLNKLENAITPDTILVSIVAVNNEIGVIQPLKEIGALCKQKGIYFHTDAAQAYGKILLDVESMNIDLMSISAHKVYGPKGIGALYVRRKPHVRLRPLFHGGEQERGLRAGTLAPFLCVGFGQAAHIAKQEMEQEHARLLALNNWFYHKITTNLDEVYLNGDPVNRIPGNLNFNFLGVEGESLMMGVKQLALSSGSACTSNSLEPSYVLKAIGVPAELSHSSLRISFGRYTTQEEIETAAELIISTVKKLRQMSPLWEIYEENLKASLKYITTLE